MADLNQEVVQANLESGTEIDQSVRELSRIELAEKIGLVKSGICNGVGSNSEAQVTVTLPQVFLTVCEGNEDESVRERYFLGHYSVVQYLEDCGILAKILTG